MMNRIISSHFQIGLVCKKLSSIVFYVLIAHNVLIKQSLHNFWFLPLNARSHVLINNIRANVGFW